MSPRSLGLVVPGPLERRTGGSMYDRRMVDSLRRRGWSVTVTELAGSFPVADARARAELADALAGKSDGALLVIDFLALAGLPDVMRAHAERLRVLALVHLLAADEPMLEPKERDHRRRLEREALESCVGIIATSPFSARRIGDVGIAEARIRTVIPGTDPAPAVLGPGRHEPPCILCLASVTPGKGQDVLVRALAELTDVSWSCVFAGSHTSAPAFVREVEALIQEARLSDRITLVGECDESAVEDLFRTSSIFVLPSYHESYGMALTEAMARGLPIISTTAGAIPETVPDGAGILVAPGDAAALGHALRSLLEDPSDATDRAGLSRASLGEAGRRHAMTLPTWNQQERRFAEVIAEFAPEEPPRGANAR